MKLLSLRLTNVRKFSGRCAAITGFGPGITVVSEANEFGKSTFFDALHAVCFERFGSTAKPVRSLRPYAGGPVEIEAEIETGGAGFRVTKRFLSRPMARIARLSDGMVIAQDDEAERWLGEELGASGAGPAGLLWVRQGMAALDSEGTKGSLLTETRRDLLSSVAGEIDAMTGGRRMDRVLRRLAEDLGQITTKTGRKAGPWKVASDEVEALEASLARLEEEVGQLEGALAERRDLEARRARLHHPEAEERRRLAAEAAGIALEAAKAHAGLVLVAQRECEIATLRARGAREALGGFLTGIETLASAEAARGAAAERLALAAQEEAGTRIAAEATRSAQEAARATAGQARKALETARQRLEARRARDEAARLADQIARAAVAQAEREAAEAKVRASRATADWLAAAEAAESEVARLEAGARAKGATLRMIYSGVARARMNGAPITGEVTVEGEARIDLPGIGEMVLRTQGPSADGARRLAEARTRRDAVLAEAGMEAIEAARLCARDRAEAAQAAELARAMLATLAPEGIDALRARKAEADLAAGAADEAPLPATDVLIAGVAAAEEAEALLAERLRAAEEETAGSRDRAAQARAADEAAAADLARAAAASGPVETREARRSELLSREAVAAEALERAEVALAEVTAAAPDLDSAEAENRRALEAEVSARGERAQVAERLAALSAQIRTLAGNGIEERRDEVRGQLETARAREARFADKAAALIRLRAALEAERDAARETYFGPVQEELRPLLAILHRDAALTFDSESLLPAGLTRGQERELLDDLSGGTREQIAILTRLAFARLFVRRGRHMPIVLDDALVHSDDDRIIKMFTALTRVARDQQIIVFSCRQLAFQDLGGARPEVTISEV